MNPFETSNNGVSGLLAGVLGFFIAPLLDWLSLKKVSYIKPGIILLVNLLWAYALYAVAFGEERFGLPGAASAVGWFLLLLSVFLLAYSLFIEIPFAKTYAQSGVSSKLVTAGTYALTRHPGVLWFGLFLVALLLVTRSSILLIAAPIWFLMDILWVILEDKYFFVLMFEGYRQYQKETPMLIPNRVSIKRCFKTLNKGGNK